MNFTLDISGEILTGDIIARACRAKGLDAELVFIVDSSDPLRHVYKFLDEEYEEYIGHRLSNSPPDQDGKPITKRFKQVVHMQPTFGTILRSHKSNWSEIDNN